MTPGRTPSSSTLTETPKTPSARAPSRTRNMTWAHVPSTLTLAWMAISLPLVAWDTGYVLLRPLSMPGGALHSPLWLPYKLYGEVDHMYGQKQWDAGNGFTSAQGTLNLIESLMYGAYLYLWWANAKPLPARYGGKMAVSGRAGGLAVLLGFSAAVMTVSKTLLYCELTRSRRRGPCAGCVNILT